MTDYKKIFAQEMDISGTFQECYAFSIHKAGSSLMHKMIIDVCNLSNIPAISIPDILFLEGISEIIWENDENIINLITPGRIYCGFRQFPNLLLNESLNLKDKKSVLLVRDPRDALVSEFFSFGGKNISHTMPEKTKESFIKEVQTNAYMDINQYVLNSAKYYQDKLNAYKNKLNFDNVLIFKYEDIYFDKRKFLSDIFNHFSIAIESNILDHVANENDIRPEVEDITKHIRKGTPGDYKQKLKPSTIDKLNEMFTDIAAWYGYDLYSNP